MMNSINDNKFDDYILILKTLAVNLPILQSWGYIFPRLLRLVVEPGMQARVMDALQNFESCESRNTWRSDFRFYVTNNPGKDFVTKIRNGLYQRNPKMGLPTIVTDNPIVDDEENSFFYIFMDERRYSSDYRIGEIVPYSSDLEAIHQKLSEQDDYELTEEERTLKAAVFFLEPYFFRKGKLERIRELLDLVHSICIMDENVRDAAQDIPDVFVKCLFKWQEDTNFYDIVDMSGEGELVVELNEAIFYDDENVYMSEKMFKKIVEPMREYAPINSIKRSLREYEYLSVNKNSADNNYTTKVTIPGSKGNRVRMMKFIRKSLLISGGLDFIDTCYFSSMRGEEDE